MIRLGRRVGFALLRPRRVPILNGPRTQEQDDPAPGGGEDPSRLILNPSRSPRSSTGRPPTPAPSGYCLVPLEGHRPVGEVVPALLGASVTRRGVGVPGRVGSECRPESSALRVHISLAVDTSGLGSQNNFTPAALPPPPPSYSPRLRDLSLSFPRSSVVEGSGGS